MNRDSKRPNPKEKMSALDRMLDMSERALEMKMTKAAHSAMEEAPRIASSSSILWRLSSSMAMSLL